MSESVRRVTLPLDGTAVDVATLAGGSSGPFRIAFSGTVTSALDGSEIDAVSRWTGSIRHETEGPFVVLPPGSRLVESDPLSHRYVFVLPAEASLPVRFHVAPLATRHLVTRSEATGSLTGAIEADITIPAVAPIAAVSARARNIPLPVALAGLSLLGGGILIMHRRRNREEVRLQRRARQLARRIGRDARELGPIFEGVEASTSKLLETVDQLRLEIEESALAARRLRGLDPEASWERSEALRKKGDDLRAHMRTLVLRLEDLAARLATRGVEDAAPTDVGAVLERLDGEVAAAIRAERELQSTGSVRLVK